jgi:hypothetical protein
MTTVATLVKRYALWKAQEGATIAELEQYQASISLPSTIKMIVLLRVFSFASFALVFIWSWYYLGSQAVSREYTFQESARKTHTNLIFPNAEVPSQLQNASSLQSVDWSDINSLFNSAYDNSGGTNSKTSVGGTDIGGNAVLPILDPTFSGHKQWCTTSNYGFGGTCMLSYASYIGVPVFSRGASWGSSAWVGDFQLSTSYIYANCSNPTIGNATDFPPGANPLLKTSFNATNQTSNGYAQVQVYNRVSNSSIHTTCNLERHYVDAQALCDTSACIFNQARRTPGKPTAPATQFLDFAFSKLFFENLLVTNGVPNSEEDVSNVETPGFYYENGAWAGGMPNVTLADMALEFSVDMSMFINTYMAASQQEFYYGPTVNSSADALEYFKKSPLNVIYPLATAKGATYDPQYVLSIPWITIDIITCSILFAAAAASLWLRINTVAPDIFGYVSSMTRDNPHMNLPDGGSTMSGSERARALKNLKVKVADLNGGHGVGHIGLAPVDLDVEMGRLQKKRHYM